MRLAPLRLAALATSPARGGGTGVAHHAMARIFSLIGR